MKDRTFSIILFAVLGVCVLLTFAYAIYAYQHCSIIEFIAKELW